MVPQSRFVRNARWIGFSLSFLALVALLPTTGCGKKNRAQPGPVALDPEEIKTLVGHLARKKSIGMGITDARIPAANQLGDIGPPAKEYGAIPALEKMAADKKEPKAQAAAEEALKKIRGQ